MKMSFFPSKLDHVFVALFSFIVATHSASAQLAITEVMSSAGTNRISGMQYPDFWELRNFGPNTISLDEYLFSDDRGIYDGMPNADFFSGKQIGPSESIVLVKTASLLVETPAQFRSWWGDANLPTNLQIYFYSNPGFGGKGDSVQLFHVTATATTLVDRVDFLGATTGATFTSHPDTGEFGILS